MRISDGSSDVCSSDLLHQFKYDCGFHQVPWPFACEHTNFKKVFTDRHPIKKRVGLGTALTMAGLGFDGTPHRGIDDARINVRLLPVLLGEAVLPFQRFCAITSTIVSPRMLR